jgi:hypothetical protein
MAAMIDKTALIAEFEQAYDEETAAGELKSQAKVIMDGVKERIEGFAEESEVAKKYVHEAYIRFKKFKQKKLKASDEDFYAIIEAVDEHFIEEEEAEKKE